MLGRFAISGLAGGYNGAWRSLVARSVRDAEVGGSNPLAPTRSTPWETAGDYRVVGCRPTSHTVVVGNLT